MMISSKEAGHNNPPMRNLYPTAEDIMSAPVTFRQETIDSVLKWKEQWYKNWKVQDTDEKWYALISLVDMLSQVYRDKAKQPGLAQDKFERCERYPNGASVIYLNPAKLSIITTFHEFAHHLYGDSEFKACRWSVWLFKTCFPLEFKTLDFRGHLLVKRVL